MTTTQFERPGVSDDFLVKAGCVHVGENDCLKTFGFRAEGKAIPFRHANGLPMMVNDRPFARVRLYHATDSQKYDQRKDSGNHIYVPPTFAQSPKGSRLILVEGEFKALALAEAGYTALGLCGFTGAARSLTRADGGRSHQLHDELVELLKMHQPAQVIFLGDSDVVLNAQFAVESAKLRPLLFAPKQFQFVERFTVAKLPLDGAKGIDDLRAEKGDAFTDCFEAILTNAYDVPAKATGTEVFVTLLNREIEIARRLISQEGHEGSRARIRLLQSAAQLWKETSAPLELKPLLAEVLGIAKSEVTSLVRDAADKKEECELGKNEAKENTQGHALNLPDVELWHESVNGAEVLSETAESFGRYVSLPPGGADALALWTAHSHCFDAFGCSPRLCITSPERGCGKTTLRDVLAVLVPRALPSENLTAAVLFRVIEKRKPVVLADEYDAWICDNEELRGMLNAGHKRGGQALRCEGDNHEVRAFNVFSPVVLCGIGALPGTLHDRSITIPLIRAKPGELHTRFDSRRTTREQELSRKLARWCADHAAQLEASDPALPSRAFNRLGDNWRPLFAIAEIAGGDWPARAVSAFTKLTSREDADAQGMGVMLLADIRLAFSEAHEERMFSKALVNILCAMTDRPWGEAHRGKSITETWLARQLKSFSILSRNVRCGAEQAKGYELEAFADAFARYLPGEGESKRPNVPSPANIGDCSLFNPSHAKTVGRIENEVSTNKDGPWDAGTDRNPGTVEITPERVYV
jgi:hypothetical protein